MRSCRALADELHYEVGHEQDHTRPACQLDQLCTALGIVERAGKIESNALGDGAEDAPGRHQAEADEREVPVALNGVQEAERACQRVERVVEHAAEKQCQRENASGLDGLTECPVEWVFGEVRVSGLANRNSNGAHCNLLVEGTTIIGALESPPSIREWINYTTL